jgi:FkbM family methyltransferase
MGDGTRILSRLANRVYAFEPSRGSYLVLSTFGGRRKNVQVFNLALSDHSGIETLNRDRNFSGVASFKPLAGVEYKDSEKVTVARLADLELSRQLTALVVDCEGSEVEVLRGAEPILPRLKTILVETHSLSDGSTTVNDVLSQLRPYFPDLRVESAGAEQWVLGRANGSIRN